MDEGDAVGQPEGGIAQAAGVLAVQLGEHLLDEPLVLLGGVGPGLVPDHDRAHDDLLDLSAGPEWPGGSLGAVRRRRRSAALVVGQASELS
jgi:hypothetical protein